MPGAGTPVFQEPACDGFVGLLPDLTEILFQIVGDRQRLIQVESFHQSCPFILCFIEILLMLEQQKAKTLQNFPAHLVGFTLKVATKLRELLIHQLHDVKTIEHMLRIRKVFQHGGVVRTGHVGRHRLDPGLRAAKPFPEGIQGFFALSVAYKHNRSGHPVNDNREEFILLADIDFIDRNDFQMSQSRLSELPVQVLPVNTSNHRVADANVLSQIFDRHHLPQIDHQPCQAFRIVTQWLDLRQDRIQNLLAAPTFQSRCLDEQHCPVQSDPRCMHNSVKCSPMNHIPVAAFRTPVTRQRGLHPNMKYSAFSPTTLMLVA